MIMPAREARLQPRTYGFMDKTMLAERILAVLRDVAPETDVEQLDPRHSFRDQLDMDSVDYLNFVLALEAELGVRIPDADYPKLSTLASCINYLKRAGAAGVEAPVLSP
jgi:acyl carrier protein